VVEGNALPYAVKSPLPLILAQLFHNARHFPIQRPIRGFPWPDEDAILGMGDECAGDKCGE